VYSAPFDIRLAHNAKITDDELVEHVLQPDIVIYFNNEQLDQKGGFGDPDLQQKLFRSTLSKEILLQRKNCTKNLKYVNSG
jgi:hypothetical protein